MSFRNGRETLSRALSSVLWQTYDNWELILINDGSKDGAEQLVRNFQDERIHFYDDGASRGLPARLNQGINQACGQYIARMDADDIAFPERFARQVEYLQTHPEVDLLASAVLLIDGEDNAIGIMPVGQSHQEISCRPWHGFAMPHPTWMGRVDWFRSHPYDERAQKGQDQALLYRSHSTSRFAGLPDALLGYRYECLSVRKTLLGRYYYLSTVVAFGGISQLFRGLLTHSLAAIRDLISIFLGLDNQVIKTRVRPADDKLVVLWRGLVERLPYSIEKMDRR